MIPHPGTAGTSAQLATAAAQATGGEAGGYQRKDRARVKRATMRPVRSTYPHTAPAAR